MYDYGARFYDPSISLWTSVDPLADFAPDWTPYRYSFNNPIRYTDPDGMFEDEASAAAYQKEHNICGTIMQDGDAYYIQGSGDNEGGQFAFGDGASGYGVDAQASANRMTTVEKLNAKSYRATDKAVNMVMENWGFAKAGRALHNELEGRDPYTGEPGDTGELLLEGAQDMANLISNAGRVRTVLGTLGARKTSKTKSEKKINTKRKEAWEKKERLYKAEQAKATTKKDKAAWQKKINHARTQQKKSEVHWN